MRSLRSLGRPGFTRRLQPKKEKTREGPRAVATRPSRYHRYELQLSLLLLLELLLPEALVPSLLRAELAPPPALLTPPPPPPAPPQSAMLTGSPTHGAPRPSIRSSVGFRCLIGFS